MKNLTTLAFSAIMLALLAGIWLLDLPLGWPRVVLCGIWFAIGVGVWLAARKAYDKPAKK